ncbi:MAG TPA: helix-turn-helix domain-containing protein [Caulobacteraceae bacterium]|jgi:AcrR family transcriptional regulator|nr:helix-turn-helix domain-containing protein [Caulobacteraceae bacterium]
MPRQTAAALTPPLDAKSLPLRQRGKDTFESILATAGVLLAEVGFERLTTNLVCERAGLTPPALYRYFPNKYALLAELARRLMDAQDEVFIAWMEDGGLMAPTLEEGVQRAVALRKQLITLTRAQPGGMWILRAIRALPVLREVRVTSRDKVLDRHFALMRTIFPTVGEERLRTAVRLSEETTYAMIEMILEDPTLDEDRVIEEASWMTIPYFHQLAARSTPRR